MSDPVRLRFFEKLRASLETGSFVKLTLSQPVSRESALRNLYGRMVELKNGRHLSLVWHYATRDVTKNVTPADAVEALDPVLGPELERAHLFTTTGDWQFRAHPSGTSTLKASRPVFQTAPPPEHDRPKPQTLPASTPFLRALGVTNAQGEARPGMSDKLRQIERFTELLGHLWQESSLRDRTSIRVTDMGAGKGYLTFATYEFFRARGVTAEVVGIELRPDLVDLGNRVAAEVGFEKLRFVRGAIGEVPPEPTDILLALHACDTATDDALYFGLRAGAALLLVAPCCHQEVRREMAPPEALREIWRHGILFERQAEMVTDALRALLLEMHGYNASVFEFISPEHTGKNLLITAQRRLGGVEAETLRARFRSLIDFYGVREQRLARLLGEL